MEQKEIKKIIRKQMVSERDGMSLELKKQLDNQMCERIMQIIVDQKAQIIHSYLPLGSEIDITPLLETLLKNNYTVVCPKSLPKKIIQNILLYSLTDLEEGRFGTKHPVGHNEYNGNIDLYIVPGLAFDKNGYRIGYGSGYYDTYFSQKPLGSKLGICYPFQLIEDFPVESHDVQLSKVIF